MFVPSNGKLTNSMNHTVLKYRRCCYHSSSFQQSLFRKVSHVTPTRRYLAVGASATIYSAPCSGLHHTRKANSRGPTWTLHLPSFSYGSWSRKSTLLRVHPAVACPARFDFADHTVATTCPTLYSVPLDVSEELSSRINSLAHDTADHMARFKTCVWTWVLRHSTQYEKCTLLAT